MDIVVDGACGLAEVDPGDKLGEVLDQMKGWVSGQERSVIAFILDGEDLEPERIRELAHVAVDRFAKLEVLTADRGELAIGVLRELSGQLPELAKSLRSAAVSLHSGRTAQALRELAGSLAAWQEMSEGFDLAGRALGSDYSVAEQGGGGESVGDLLGKMEADLKAADAALKANDTVTVGDLLEYELSPAIERWKRLVDALLARAEARRR